MDRDKTCTCAISMHTQFLNGREAEGRPWGQVVGRDGMGQGKGPLIPSETLGSPFSLGSPASGYVGHVWAFRTACIGQASHPL